MVAGVVPIIVIYQLLDGVSAVTAGILRVKGEQVGKLTCKDLVIDIEGPCFYSILVLRLISGKAQSSGVLREILNLTIIHSFFDQRVLYHR